MFAPEQRTQESITKETVEVMAKGVKKFQFVSPRGFTLNVEALRKAIGSEFAVTVSEDGDIITVQPAKRDFTELKFRRFSGCASRNLGTQLSLVFTAEGGSMDSVESFLQAAIENYDDAIEMVRGLLSYADARAVPGVRDNEAHTREAARAFLAKARA